MICPRPFTSLLPPPRRLRILVSRRTSHIPPPSTTTTTSPSSPPPPPGSTSTLSSRSATTLSLLAILLPGPPSRTRNLPLRPAPLPKPPLQPPPHPRIPLDHDTPPLDGLVRHPRLLLQPPPRLAPLRRPLPPKHPPVRHVSPVQRLLGPLGDGHVLRVGRVEHHRAAHVGGVVRVVALVVVRVEGREGGEDRGLRRPGGGVGEEGVGCAGRVALADVQARSVEGEVGDVVLVVDGVPDRELGRGGTRGKAGVWLWVGRPVVQVSNVLILGA